MKWTTLILATLLSCTPDVPQSPLDPHEVTLQAGNATTDEARYDLFETLGPFIEGDPILYQEWSELLAFMDL